MITTIPTTTRSTPSSFKEGSTNTSSNPQADLETARSEVMAAEREIAKIKIALRGVTSSISSTTKATTISDESGDTKEDGDNVVNTLKISALKITSLPKEAEPIIDIQLSSPIESQTITSLLNDSNSNTNDNLEAKEREGTEKGAENEKDGSTAVFHEVDLDVATLVFSVSDKDIPLGISAVHSVKPLCEIDFLGGQDVKKKVTEVEIAIVPEGEDEDEDGSDKTLEDEVFVDAISSEESEKELNDPNDLEKKTDEKGIDKQEKQGEEMEDVEEAKTSEKKVTDKEESTLTTNDDAAAEEETDENNETIKPPSATKIQLPTCVVHIRVEFIPSKNDEKNSLYDLLNKVSKEKASAIEKLRKAAEAINRLKSSDATSLVVKNGDGSGVNAIKSGFLNKTSKNKKEPMALVRWYQRVLGPQSLVVKVFPIVKNYLFFFVGTLLMHYQGHQLALPPPV